ncbi:phosphatase PAP2 family protein [Tuanshanicoccus lijuaniae]|uniref:phosphatase PAP2 family protein n=1 Tax=Aerococcaceae bacterium zg-1292 TaxID=2774330 RepID=UPI0019363EF7|nr:phosphatase PAP2 family protein [Aerococcaceae bacterium zg-1292]QQA36399.1 phosphatase PAP2 family protein [Aerococcaceae bacterium zg-1292]
MTKYELFLMDWIQQQMQFPLLKSVLLFFTKIGDYGIVWIALAVFLVLFKRTRKLGITVSITLLLMLIVNNGILKNVIERVRPCQIHAQINQIIECPTSFSFPSGHSSSSFAVLGVFLFTQSVKAHWKWLVFVVAFLIAFSRVYLYVHFPSDIVAGASVGIVLAWVAVYWIAPRVKVCSDDDII